MLELSNVVLSFSYYVHLLLNERFHFFVTVNFNQLTAAQLAEEIYLII